MSRLAPITTENVCNFDRNRIYVFNLETRALDIKRNDFGCGEISLDNIRVYNTCTILWRDFRNCYALNYAQGAGNAYTSRILRKVYVLIHKD